MTNSNPKVVDAPSPTNRSPSAQGEVFGAGDVFKSYVIDREYRQSSSVSGIRFASNVYLLFGIVLLVVFVLLLLLQPLGFVNRPVIPSYVVVPVAAGIIAFLVGGVIGHLYANTRAQRIRELEDSFGRSAEESYFNQLVKINVLNLGAYYDLVKAQTNRSFVATLVIAIAGFGLVLVGLGFSLFGNATQVPTARVATASGVITEFIAAVFFYLYTRTVLQLKDYHDSLLSVQNLLLSFKLVGDVQDSKDKVQMMQQMLGYLVNRTGSAPSRNQAGKADSDL